jgi:hypothetical protein
MNIGDTIRGNADNIVDIVKNKNTHARENELDGVRDTHTGLGTVTVPVTRTQAWVP